MCQRESSFIFSFYFELVPATRTLYADVLMMSRQTIPGKAPRVHCLSVRVVTPPHDPKSHLMQLLFIQICRAMYSGGVCCSKKLVPYTVRSRMHVAIPAPCNPIPGLERVESRALPSDEHIQGEEAPPFGSVFGEMGALGEGGVVRSWGSGVGQAFRMSLTTNKICPFVCARARAQAPPPPP